MPRAGRVVSTENTAREKTMDAASRALEASTSLPKTRVGGRDLPEANPIGVTSTLTLDARQGYVKAWAENAVGSGCPGIDEPLAMSRGGQVYYYVTDALGSVNAVTNSSASVQNTYLYDAWGQIKSQTGSLANPFTYTSREAGEAGLNFYRARYYQPAVGRFLQEDPLTSGLGLSNEAYRYVLNGPALYGDPTGLECKTYFYRGAPEEYRKPDISDSGWVPLPSLKPPIGAAPPVAIVCRWFKILRWTRYLRQLVTVAVVCTCPDLVLSITEWNTFTKSGQSILNRERTVWFPDRCPTDPDSMFP
jgi:RHS repeat-associated protein